MKKMIANPKRNRTSLQKTTSLLTNILTHRNSVVSDTQPLFYNNSLLSLRTASLLHSQKRVGSLESKLKNIPTAKNASDQKSLSKQLSHQYGKQISSRQLGTNKRRDQTTKQKIKIIPCNLGSKRQSSKTRRVKRISSYTQASTDIDKRLKSISNAGLNFSKLDYSNLLKKTQMILESYQVYTERIEEQKNQYKSKYKQALKKLKKYQQQ